MSDPDRPPPDKRDRPFSQTIRLDVRDGTENTKPHPMASEIPRGAGGDESSAGEVAEPLDLLEAVMAALPTGLLLLDPAGVIVGLNRAAATIFEREISDLVGRRLRDVRAELESMLWPADKQEVLLVAQGRAGEFAFRDSKVLGFTSRTVTGPDGTPRGTVVSFSDITEAKLREKQDAHRRRLEDLGRITATLAHEIRNPIFAIQSLAHVLAGEPCLEGWEEGQEIVRRIVEETRRISALVDDLLTFGRRKDLERRKEDLVALVADVVGTMRRSIEDRMSDVRIEFPAEEGEGGAVWAHVDREAMRRVVLNLVRNAVTAVERARRGAEGVVRIEVEAAADGALLRVEDNGVGIPAEHLQRIFEEFYTTTSSGTGLGLAVCRAVVQQHGGEISLESVEGEGTVVTVRIPH